MDGQLGVGVWNSADGRVAEGSAAETSVRSGSRGSARILNLPNSLPSGEGLCLEPLMKGVPSGFFFLVRPGLPCFRDTP